MKKYAILAVFLLGNAFASAQTIWTSETKMRGTIGGYEIVMTLAIPNGGASTCFTIGKYYYVSQRRNIDLCSNDDQRIIERVDGKATGYFVIAYWNKAIGQTVTGRWYSMDRRKSYPVTLKVIGKGRN